MLQTCSCFHRFVDERHQKLPLTYQALVHIGKHISGCNIVNCICIPVFSVASFASISRRETVQGSIFLSLLVKAAKCPCGVIDVIERQLLLIKKRFPLLCLTIAQCHSGSDFEHKNDNEPILLWR